MIKIVISFFLIIGTFFIFSGTLGVLRFPDVYSRLHAASKASTLGVSGILIGSFIYVLSEMQLFSGKLILGILFVLMTAPVAGHMISRAAYRTGVPLSEKTVFNDLEENNKSNRG
ncbi:Na+/H+ antiporter subunit G [Fictibacillus barbaricus]|uniref:Na+/H+ antiporter subunit G n=1 Tax=Fictibacillus barbaricus TaxID=182136 RepID=A0ABS2ZH98_9BACL|nr:monovalent cation/H(+) antiporter subunit G [Fictibacillus barbaricus]MBN3547548.1 Na+/H+ antiporter subunit G [Fictibacillus barbaricus]GGB49771.1 Na+/H+ antiporter subunit G [Fictibacillus barbaricus]